MQITDLPFAQDIEPINQSAISTDGQLFVDCIEQMDKTAWLGHIADIANVTFSSTDTPDTITTNTPFALGEFRTFPYTVEHTEEGQKIRVKGVLRVPYTETLNDLLLEHNALILNGNLNNSLFGGFLIFTLGNMESNAEVKISDKNISDDHLTIPINILSGVIS